MVSIPEPANFLGLDAAYSGPKSRAWVLPVPYEATTSYKGGTKDGPRAIIEASAQVEFYDAELGMEPAMAWGIHTLPALAPSPSSPEAAIGAIAAAVQDLAGSGKLLAILGGEHAISAGVARGLAEAHGELAIVQLDAHADLRDSYEGTPYSHACAARRILESGRIFQLGIRSLDIGEAAYLRENAERVTCIPAELMRNAPYLEQLANFVESKPVFLTIDLDVFDCSLMPSTGTPEPGGLFWYDVLSIIRTVAAHGNVVGFDCVELSPNPGLHAPDYLAAKLVYKTISLILQKQCGKPEL